MSERSSHFFKVVLPATLEDRKLKIPEKFVREFGDELSAGAKIKVPNGQVWQVGLIKDGINVWFCDGWHDFVKYYSIGAGYFLVFKYEMDSNFHVLIFDSSACEVHYPSVENQANPPFGSTRGSNRIGKFGTTFDSLKLKHSREIQMKKCKTEGEVVMYEPNVVSQSRRTCKVKKNAKYSSQGSLHRKRHLDEYPENAAAYKVSPHSSDEENKRTKKDKDDFLARLEDMGISIAWRFKGLSAEERERAINIATYLKPKNPSFMIILRSNNMNNCRVYVPLKFAKLYLKNVAKFSKLQCSDGREWSVEIRWCNPGCFIKNGWAEFSNDNNLKEGDMCLFELNKDFLLKVSVFHVPNN